MQHTGINCKYWDQERQKCKEEGKLIVGKEYSKEPELLNIAKATYKTLTGREWTSHDL